MELRKITVISTRDHIKKTFKSSAKTLAELKDEMTVNGISHEGLSYFEGITKAEYKDNSSALPTVVTYEDPNTGEEKTTTELVFILSQPNKKIKSGAATRAEVCAQIKDMKLEEKCKKMYGRDFTQVSTDDLIRLIECDEEERNSIPKNGICQKEVQAESEIAQTPESIRTMIACLKEQIENIEKAIRILTELSSDVSFYNKSNIESFLDESSPVKSTRIEIEDTGVKSDLPKSIFEGLDNADWME